MLVIPDSKYTYGILIQIGTQVIWMVMWMVNEQNINKLSEAWRNTYVNMVMAGQLTLGETAKDIIWCRFLILLIKSWSKLVISGTEHLVEL